MPHPKLVDEELLDAAARLVYDHDELPAGLVLSSFYRTVWCLRRTGAQASLLASEAERLCREMLALRSVPEDLLEASRRSVVPTQRLATP